MKRKRIGIIGAGRFGMSLAESLTNAGMEVVLVDRNRPAMQLASEFATAVQGDATQPHVLEEAGSWLGWSGKQAQALPDRRSCLGFLTLTTQATKAPLLCRCGPCRGSP